MKNKVKEIREQHSLTQEQLAQKIGVSRQSIISIEKGYYVPTTVLALKIAGVLKVTTEELFTLEEGRAGVVVAFIAILELLKGSIIEIVQTEPFAPIHIRSASHEL